MGTGGGEGTGAGAWGTDGAEGTEGGHTWTPVGTGADTGLACAAVGTHTIAVNASAPPIVAILLICFLLVQFELLEKDRTRTAERFARYATNQEISRRQLNSRKNCRQRVWSTCTGVANAARAPPSDWRSVTSSGEADAPEHGRGSMPTDEEGAGHRDQVEEADEAEEQAAEGATSAQTSAAGSSLQAEGDRTEHQE
ncbi:MAG TPA: hypothetical protein VGL04_04000 [Sporichthyaceae bacterium]